MIKLTHHLESSAISQVVRDIVDEIPALTGGVCCATGIARGSGDPPYKAIA